MSYTSSLWLHSSSTSITTTMISVKRCLISSSGRYIRLSNYSLSIFSEILGCLSSVFRTIGIRSGMVIINWKEALCAPSILFTLFDEETRPKWPVLFQTVCNCSGNCWLPSSSHPIQPEYAFSMWWYCPLLNITEQFSPSPQEAFIMLVLIRIKCGSFCSP